MKRKIILASGSKSRKKLIKSLGFNFETEKSNYNEDMREKLPMHKLAQKIALGKAQAVAQKHKNAIIIGADTFGIIDRKLIGQAKTPIEAKKALKLISGRKHKLITGIAIVDTQNNKIISDYDISEVWIKRLSQKEIDCYVKTGEPLFKAPAYTIEGLGSVFVEKIRGNDTAIIGLPMNKIYNHLIKLGVNILEKPYYNNHS
ncbi:MAG: Maf family protein [Patescibacteria group bacterium]|nr:Maf family protein [Patescibacteria group bacterium]